MYDCDIVCKFAVRYNKTMKIFSPTDISEIFRYTIEHDGVSMTELVNRTGAAVAQEISERCEADTGIVVFAGWGINGAYALASARYLIEHGYSPKIFLFNIGGNRICGDCANQKKFLLKRFPKAAFNEITITFDIPELEEDCVVIDGLFGIDIDRPIPKSFSMLIRDINESGASVVSLEIPSGLFSVWNTNNSIARDIIHATLTLCVGSPSLSFFMNENIGMVGEWKVLDIGLSRRAMADIQTNYYLVTQSDVRRLLKPRRQETSKADYGSALICAGSYGMMGAAVLAAKGCLRSGVGKLTCYAPKCGCNILQTAVPCAMYSPDVSENFISRISPSKDFDSIAVGPGIGTNDTTVNAVEAFLKFASSKCIPVVIDADALNCIAARPILMNYIPAYSVLTPHVGEFDRIFSQQPSSEARLRRSAEIAAYHNIVMVLKGRYTSIVRSDGKVYFNSSGTPALATPGSGDVLTGVITGLIAQGYAPETAAVIGVYVHGKAGEIAEKTYGSYGVTAEDVADAVGKSICSILK